MMMRLLTELLILTLFTNVTLGKASDCSGIIDGIKITCEIQKYVGHPNTDVKAFIEKIFINACYDHQLNGLKYEFGSIKEDADVVFFDVHDKILPHLPIKIYANYPKLQLLAARNVGLRSITYENLRQLTDLKTLNLESNKIETLESNLFTDNPNLRHINLQNNKLFKLDQNVFDSTKRLVKLYLAGNLCIDKSYDFKETTKLELNRDLIETCSGFQNMKSFMDQKIQEVKEDYKSKVDRYNSLKADLELQQEKFLEEKKKTEDSEVQMKSDLERTMKLNEDLQESLQGKFYSCAIVIIILLIVCASLTALTFFYTPK